MKKVDWGDIILKNNKLLIQKNLNISIYVIILRFLFLFSCFLYKKVYSQPTYIVFFIFCVSINGFILEQT